MDKKKVSAAILIGAVASVGAWRALRPDPAPSVLAGGAAAWRTSPLFTVRSLPPLAPPSARFIDRDTLPDGTVRLLLTGAGNGASACELRGSGSEEALHCGAAIEVLPESARLAKQSDVLAAWGIPRERPDDPAASFASDGAALRLVGDKHDGYVIALSKKDARFHAVAIEQGERKASVPLVDGARTPFIVPGAGSTWAFYVSEDSRGGPALGGVTLGDTIGIFSQGMIPADVRPQLCRVGNDASVVVLRHGDDARRWPVALWHEGGWTVQQADATTAAASSVPPPPPAPPAPSAPPTSRAEAIDRAGPSAFGIIGLLDADDIPPPRWGLPDDMAADARQRAMFGDRPQDSWQREVGRKDPVVPRHAITCAGGVARVTWRETDGESTRIVRSSCDGGGCRVEEATLAGLGVDTFWIAATLEERVLLVWRAAGVVRMRLAPFDALATAGDVALMDSEHSGGPRTQDLEAFVANDRVVFLFRDDAGAHGLRIGADGSYRALSRAPE